MRYGAAARASGVVTELERFPCRMCGAMILKPHDRNDCSWNLRDQRDVARAEAERLRRELAEAQAALVVAQAMAGQR